MIHRLPTPRPSERRRQAERLRARAALLNAGSSTFVVIGMYAVVLALALTDELIPRLASATPFLFAVGLAALARSARTRGNVHEREADQLISGFRRERCMGSRRRYGHLRLSPDPDGGCPGVARTGCNGGR